MDFTAHASLFLLAFSSIFPLVNPIGTALIISPYFEGTTDQQRKDFSAKVAFFCFILGLGSLLLGSWLLRFMGLSVSTIQLAGGIVVAMMGLDLLNSKPKDIGAPADAATADTSRSLFYPIAFPLTVGPGTISVLIALSAHVQRPKWELTSLNLLVVALSLLAVCTLTYLIFANSDRLLRRIGSQGSLVVNRLSAFLVFCIGIQMTIGGLKSTFPHILVD